MSEQPDLFGLYCAGETLIIEYLGFRQYRSIWLREEKYSIVGYEPEFYSVRCDGSADVSRMLSPGSTDEDACELCRKHLVHTAQLHAAAKRFGDLRL